ncbi:MAG: LON peptidase substrate-binding domain-containing protein [Pirellulales bacterium]
MSTPDLSLPDNFAGRVRLFPLPNMVLFPHVVQPLHIFEPRYRSLLEDALADDQLMAIATLAPGWENDYEGRPALFPVCCLGRVTAHQRLDDGRYNLLLMGLRRVRIMYEPPTTRPFRMAEVELLSDHYSVAAAGRQAALRERLVQVLRKLMRKLPKAEDQLTQLFDSPMPLGVLADIVAYTLELPWAFKLELLGELDADCRATMLLDRLNNDEEESPARRKFPPDVSLN